MAVSRLRARCPKPPHLEISTSSEKLFEEARLATVPTRVDKLTAPSERNITREFHILDDLVGKEMSVPPRLSNFNPDRDYCDDAIPYVEHRAQTLDGGYINASVMRSTSLVGAFIAAQGPLKNTVADFWSMIVNHHVTRIVALCADDECAKYVPDVSETLSLLDGAIKVQFKSEECLTTVGDLSRSCFEVCCGGESWVVTRLHCSSWCDEEACSLDSLLHLAELVDGVEAAATVVHCKAGAGRTGSFLALCSLLADVKNQLRKVPDCVPCTSVARTVVELRKHRPHMVQTLQQYQMIYSALGEWYRNQCVCQSGNDSHSSTTDGEGSLEYESELPYSADTPSPSNPVSTFF